MKYYLLPVLFMIVVLAGCSKPSAEELYARAESALKTSKAEADSLGSAADRLKIYTPALEAFERVVKDHPKSALAERAQFFVATIRSNDTHQPELAIEAYREYVSRYPDGAQAPLSMFLIGYLYNNELHNLDSAAAAYKRFLAKYPDSEMAMSAQFELKTLGKSAEELLQQMPAPQADGKRGAKSAKL